MGFISLVFIMFLWPVWLFIIAMGFVMIWLEVALNVIVTVLLAANAIFLALLLFLRVKWKATGRMEKAFIDTYQGWRHYGLLGAKVLLTGGVIWEVLVVLVCAGLLIFRPWSVFLP